MNARLRRFHSERRYRSLRIVGKVNSEGRLLRSCSGLDLQVRRIHLGSSLCFDKLEQFQHVSLVCVYIDRQVFAMLLTEKIKTHTLPDLPIPTFSPSDSKVA